MSAPLVIMFYYLIEATQLPEIEIDADAMPDIYDADLEIVEKALEHPETRQAILINMDAAQSLVPELVSHFNYIIYVDGLENACRSVSRARHISDEVKLACSDCTLGLENWARDFLGLRRNKIFLNLRLNNLDHFLEFVETAKADILEFREKYNELAEEAGKIMDAARAANGSGRVRGRGRGRGRARGRGGAR
ncbi:hypothetical protein F4678DRAFT_461671 [Xylaria arbuscula]|nr:hypothetical protein F4678DRAFT_461671 [Xylaria arbuscula]